MKQDLVKLLASEMNLLDDAIKILNTSYKSCSRIGVKENYTNNELEKFEAFTSRFARASDILIQKILRLIDELDMESTGTLRDRINRAEKKQIVQNADILIAIRSLRNDIAHEYLPEAVKDIFKTVLEYSPSLFEIYKRVKEYAKKY